VALIQLTEISHFIRDHKSVSRTNPKRGSSALRFVVDLLRSSKVSSHQATEGRALENAGAERTGCVPARAPNEHPSGGWRSEGLDPKHAAYVTCLHINERINNSIDPRKADTE